MGSDAACLRLSGCVCVVGSGRACHLLAGRVLSLVRPLLVSLGPVLLTRLAARVPSSSGLREWSVSVVVEEAKGQAEEGWRQTADQAALLGQQHASTCIGRGRCGWPEGAE